jgi:hypothetical protein
MMLALALLALGGEDWISLFNGKDLTGWKVNEAPEGVKVEDGKIVLNGKRAHVFYVGDVKGADFKNFEFKAEVLIKPNSNSGIYFHTKFQPDGWPAAGFESQVCANGYKDPRKTGSLYAVKDLAESPVKEDEWFTYHIKVVGKKVEISLNDKLVNEWTQPDDWTPPKGMAGRKLASGTFALQVHDPGSTVWYRNLQVKPLAD